MVAARLLQAAGVERTDAVLIVGAGTGYEAAIAAMLARNVIAVEEEPELARAGARRARRAWPIASVELSSKARCHGAIGTRALRCDPVRRSGGRGSRGDRRATRRRRPARRGRQADSGVGRATLTTRTGGVLARRVIFDAATPLLPGFEPKPGFVF